MATNPQALEQGKKGKVEYEWGTLWPHYHKVKMNWAGGFRTKGDVDILFLSGWLDEGGLLRLFRPRNHRPGLDLDEHVRKVYPYAPEQCGRARVLP